MVSAERLILSESWWIREPAKRLHYYRIRTEHADLVEVIPEPDRQAYSCH